MDKLLTQIELFCILLVAVSGHENRNGNFNGNFTRIPRQINGCALPNQPKFGRWTSYRSVASSSPGDIVPLGTILEVSCTDNYKLNGDETIACLRGEWKPQIGKCLRTCPSIYSTAAMTVSCTYDGKILKSCRDPLAGTRARFQCARFYETQGLNKFPVRVCSNGQWSSGLPECVPVCGKKGITKDPTLIVGGINTTSLEYPWQVALYTKNTKTLICAGTLLNQKTIVTAAHCITDLNGKLQSKELYIVAVGKTYREYNDSRDTKSQFSSIQEMYIPRQYKGDIRRYFGDIAVLITTKTFALSTNVQPICVVWEKSFHQSLENPARIKHAYVNGWGFTAENKDPSDVLKTLAVPLITNSECEQKLGQDDIQYLADDKLCAGFLDSGMSVCKGDSGGGLVSKYDDRYYIIAVVSLAPQAPSAEGGCNSQTYGLYTSFSYYIEDFIIDIEARFRPYHHVHCPDNNCLVSSSQLSTTARTVTFTGCTLPNYPEHGRWIIYGSSSNQFLPGNIVAPNTVLKIECRRYYTLTGDKFVICDNGHWLSGIGLCLPIVGSTQSPPLNRSTCGISPLGDKQLVIDPNPSSIKYPWLAAIYRVTDIGVEYRCAGSLISNKHVVIAAHCLYSKGSSISPENLIVKLGKLTLTEDGTIIRKVDKVTTHPNYAPSSPNADIAVVELSKVTEISNYVRPVCIGSGDDLDKIVGQRGIVVTWRDSENGSVSNKPREVRMTIVSQEMCLRSSVVFTEITSDTIFCAGDRDSPSFCPFSGDGLVIKRNGLWTLAGITSFAVYDSVKKRCDLSEYVVFTNVNKFEGWLSSIINE